MIINVKYLDILKWVCSSSFLIALMINASHAQSWIEYDKSDSPYFEIAPNGADTSAFDALHLDDTGVKVNIRGSIADIVVTQTYRNQSQSTLNAKYYFPASTRAAVYGFKLDVNGRIIVAEIHEKAQAKKAFDQAVKEGKTAALLEQSKPNLFSVSAGNILPADVIKVELKYTERLSSLKGEYQFHFPQILRPRYGDQPLDFAMPFQGTRIDLTILSGTEIFGFENNWGAAHSNQSGLLTMHSSHEVKSNDEVQKSHFTKAQQRDFKASFKLADEELTSSLLTYQGDDESFFMLQVSPPTAIQHRTTLAQDFIFVMDVSGSMHGAPMDASKLLMYELLTQVNSQDRFNIVQFAGGSSHLFSQSKSVTSDSLDQAVEFIQKPNGGGGTEVLPALEAAFNLASKQQNLDGLNEPRSYNIVLITDGLVSVEREVFDLILAKRNIANTFAFGIDIQGSNRYLFEGVANSAGTTPFVLDKFSDAKKHMTEFKQYLSSPILSQIRFDFEGADIYQQTPQQFGDLFSERPIIITGKYRGELPKYITMQALAPDGPMQIKVPTHTAVQSNNQAIKYLWAREQIELLDDYQSIRENEETRKQIIALGLRYNLLTRYTSFLAIDERTRAEPNYEKALATNNIKYPGSLHDDVMVAPMRLSHLLAKQSNNSAQCPSNKVFKIAKTSRAWSQIKLLIPVEKYEDSTLCFSSFSIVFSDDAPELTSADLKQLLVLLNDQK
jgi:Ca-activated chloride channel homolog